MNALEALWRCQRAWEASQPQLFMELYPDDGLDEAELRVPLGLVEPAVAVASPEAGGLASRLTAGESAMGYGSSPGEFRSAPVAAPENVTRGVAAPAVSRVLNPGAEPSCDLLGTDGESALITAAPAHGKTEPASYRANGSAAGASAPHNNTTGPHALPPKRTRAAQEVTV